MRPFKNDTPVKTGAQPSDNYSRRYGIPNSAGVADVPSRFARIS